MERCVIVNCELSYLLLILSSFLSQSLEKPQFMTNKIKILIAEDNDFVRMQIVQYLTSEAYELVEAIDGATALELVNEGGVDMAIVDVRMEPVDGFEFIKKIRANEINIPAILVTGDNDPELLSKANEWEVGAVLIKPIQKDRLLQTVERLLQRRNG